jgi:enterochelin esterase-like enzyme
MGLTSGALIGTAIAVATGSFAAIVWTWPRVAGRHPAQVAARLTMVTVSQLLVIGAFLIWLNGYFSFYASWSQLFGVHAPRPAAGRLALQASRPVTIYASQPGPVAGRSGPAPLAAPAAGTSVVSRPGSRLASAVTGRLLQIAIRGQRTGLDSGPGFVYLPPQYFQPAYQRMRFPVVVALTGYPGMAGGLVHRLELPMVAARLLAARQIKPSVFVMLGVSPLMPLDTECTDIPAGPQVESFLAQDVPHAIQQAFRVTTSPAGWGVIGYSTGGYCATKLAMMYPDRYSAAVSMAGYYRALRGQFVPNLWGGSLAYRLENSPDWRLRHLPAPPVSILATSSKVGERSLSGTLTFLREIHPPMRGYSLIIPQGGHNFLTWNRELVPSLEWLSRRLV